MNEKIVSFLVSPQESLYEALKKIDKNKKGFLVVVDQNQILGTLTDGDMRRAFISGKSIDTLVENIYIRNCKVLNISDDIGKSIELFKNESVKFLPIVDEVGILKNILTKKQLHTLLLKDIQANLDFDFQTLDENLIDYEIFPRPWGFYKTTVMNDYCQSKIICVYPNEKLSLQSHEHREEHWIITHGNGTIQIGEDVLEAKCGQYFYIPKGQMHRLVNTDDKETLVITEVQIGDYFGEDDICRYEDIYGRK